ncbi:MAG: amidohydrolase family protein [Synergistaceae bacterium]|nr:amidohydrolase family protein [Synergistaceae bacterium]
MDIVIEGRYKEFDYLTVDSISGKIKSMGKGRSPQEPDHVFPEGYVLSAGDFNAHSHPEQSIYVEIADRSWNLARWCRETIYRYSVKMTSEMIYYGCVRAFGHMLSFGETSVMVSFYCHNKKGNELDLAVIKAAEDTGIRLFFGRMNYDVVNGDAYPEKKSSQLSYYETPEEAEKNFTALLAHENSRVIVAPALHSFHANSLEAVVRGIELGRRYRRKVQLHLSEDEGDVKLCLEKYGMRPVEVLASLEETGRVAALDHLILSDCVWTSRREKELIKKHGMSVVLNGRMNEQVKAGTAEVREYISMEIPLYTGTDGEASNDDLSIKNERKWLKEKHKLSKEEEQKLAVPFETAGIRVGELEAGAAADIKVCKNGRTEALFVGGKLVMKDGELLSKKIISDSEAFIRDMWKK